MKKEFSDLTLQSQDNIHSYLVIWKIEWTKSKLLLQFIQGTIQTKLWSNKMKNKMLLWQRLQVLRLKKLKHLVNQSKRFLEMSEILWLKAKCLWFVKMLIIKLLCIILSKVYIWHFSKPLHSWVFAPSIYIILKEF